MDETQLQEPKHRRLLVHIARGDKISCRTAFRNDNSLSPMTHKTRGEKTVSTAEKRYRKHVKTRKARRLFSRAELGKETVSRRGSRGRLVTVPDERGEHAVESEEEKTRGFDGVCLVLSALTNQKMTKNL